MRLDDFAAYILTQEIDQQRRGEMQSGYFCGNEIVVEDPVGTPPVFETDTALERHADLALHFLMRDAGQIVQPDAEPRRRTLADPDGWNAGVENRDQLRVR